MGHRASYAIRQDGQVLLFRSHWGALTVPQDMFWGPEHAERFIRSLETCDEWIGELDAEGGVGLDLDRQHIAFFGGVDLAMPAIRPLFVELMATIWGEHGWTVAWVDGIAEVAASVGVDPTPLTWQPIAPSPVAIDALGARFASENMYQGLISVRDGSRWHDRVVDHAMSSLLIHGPTILEHLDRLPDLEACRSVHASRALRDHERERGTLGDHLEQAVLVDPLQRRLVCRSAGIYHEPDDEPFVRSAWPDWQVEWLVGTLAEHIAATGRAVSAEHHATRLDVDEPEAPTQAEALDLIRSELLGSDQHKADILSFARGVADRIEAAAQDAGRSWWRRLWQRFGKRGSAKTQWSPGFFRELPAAGPEPELAERMLDRAIAARRQRHRPPPRA